MLFEAHTEIVVCFFRFFKNMVPKGVPGGWRARLGPPGSPFCFNIFFYFFLLLGVLVFLILPEDPKNTVKIGTMNLIYPGML